MNVGVIATHTIRMYVALPRYLPVACAPDFLYFRYHSSAALLYSSCDRIYSAAAATALSAIYSRIPSVKSVELAIACLAYIFFTALRISEHSDPTACNTRTAHLWKDMLASFLHSIRFLFPYKNTACTHTPRTPCTCIHACH